MDQLTSAEYPVNNLDSVSTGRRLLMNVDGRTAWARRFRYLVQAHIDDLGGEGNVSQAEQQIIRRVAALAVELEKLEASFAVAEWDRSSGRPSTALLDLYSRLSGGQRRLLESVGLQRRARDVGPARYGDLEPFLREQEDDDRPTDPDSARRNNRERAKRQARQRTRTR